MSETLHISKNLRRRRAALILAVRHTLVHALCRLSGWRPIASAPRDGSTILLVGPDGGTGPRWHIAVGRFIDGGWRDEVPTDPELIYVRLWRPLPWLPRAVARLEAEKAMREIEEHTDVE